VTKLLIVDDEPYTVEMLETFLKLHGFETFGALCGEDSLVLVRVEHPEIVILDLMLPDMEGYEVCRRIRSYPESATLPVLILSARADAESKERAMAAGANAYLVKPARFPVLLETLRRLLASPVEAAKSEAAGGTPKPAAVDMPGSNTSDHISPIAPAGGQGDSAKPRVTAPEKEPPKTDPA
jgi:DNA-binding response OmpR family regulator